MTAAASQSDARTGSPVRKVFQSASRNETYLNCTALYAAKYIHRIPDTGNDGSRRGSVCHDVLELLLKPRHKDLYLAAIKHQTCTEVPVLQRYIKLLARKHGLTGDENLEMVDTFILVALMNQFFGPPGTVETFGEKEFTLEVDEDGKRYNTRGYIDKTFIVRDKSGEWLDTVDYKGSAKVFDSDKLDDNTQAKMYQLALKRLYPHISRRQFRFLFLRFPKKAWQQSPSLTDDQLEGFEYLLTDMQERLEGFTEENALDNVAAHDQDRLWMCGRYGTKKDGTPMWVCPARRPMDYWVVVKDGAISRSAMTEAELTAKPDQALKEGETIEMRRYNGCPIYHFPNGNPRGDY